jgi:outer membrane protein TolC
LSLARQLTFALAAGAMLVATALAQSPAVPLTLHDAANIAMEKNPLRKAALADTRAASADMQTARSFFLPHVTFSETATLGNDQATRSSIAISNAGCRDSPIAAVVPIATLTNFLSKWRTTS